MFKIIPDKRKPKIIILIFFFCLLALSCIKPLYPAEMFLQHSVTLVMSVILLTVTRRNSLSDRSFIMIVVFMTLHVIGARWIYSYVPYDEWFRAITGSAKAEIFHTGRNHYDRFVHLMFGLLMYFPVKEVYERWFGCPAKFSPVISFLTITGCSLIYEVFEWVLTLLLSPEDAENYNGQQGDIWDAQKDMALAFAGAAVNLTVSLIINRKSKSIKESEMQDGSKDPTL